MAAAWHKPPAQVQGNSFEDRLVQHEGDGELLQRLSQGEMAAFRQLAQRHTARLLATARSVLREEAEAEDIVQEAMLRLWRSAGELVADEDNGGIGAWLNRVVRNLAIDKVRQARRVELVDEFPDAPASETDPLGDLEEQERKRQVDEAIDELPERQRLAILMFHHRDMSVAEIGAALQTSEHAAESLLARARRTLKQRLETLLRSDAK